MRGHCATHSDHVKKLPLSLKGELVLRSWLCLFCQSGSPGGTFFTAQEDERIPGGVAFLFSIGYLNSCDCDCVMRGDSRNATRYGESHFLHRRGSTSPNGNIVQRFCDHVEFFHCFPVTHSCAPPVGDLVFMRADGPAC